MPPKGTLRKFVHWNLKEKISSDLVGFVWFLAVFGNIYLSFWLDLCWSLWLGFCLVFVGFLIRFFVWILFLLLFVFLLVCFVCSLVLVSIWIFWFGLWLVFWSFSLVGVLVGSWLLFLAACLLDFRLSSFRKKNHWTNFWKFSYLEKFRTVFKVLGIFWNVCVKYSRKRKHWKIVPKNSFSWNMFKCFQSLELGPIVTSSSLTSVFIILLCGLNGFLPGSEHVLCGHCEEFLRGVGKLASTSTVSTSSPVAYVFCVTIMKNSCGLLAN